MHTANQCGVMMQVVQPSTQDKPTKPDRKVLALLKTVKRSGRTVYGELNTEDSDEADSSDDTECSDRSDELDCSDDTECSDCSDESECSDARDCGGPEALVTGAMTGAVARFVRQWYLWRNGTQSGVETVKNSMMGTLGAGVTAGVHGGANSATEDGVKAAMTGLSEQVEQIICDAAGAVVSVSIAAIICVSKLVLQWHHGKIPWREVVKRICKEVAARGFAVVGALVGECIGVLVGSLFGPVGTIAGGIVGSIVGGLAGRLLGRFWSK